MKFKYKLLKRHTIVREIWSHLEYDSVMDKMLELFLVTFWNNEAFYRHK